MPCDRNQFLVAGSRLGVRHQPSIWGGKRLTSQAPQVSPGFQAGSTFRSWLCTSTDVQSAGVFPEKGRDRCGPSSTLAMSSWLSGMEQNFAEKLDLCSSSSMLRISRRLLLSRVFKSSVTAQEDLVRTESYPLQSIRWTCGTSTASRSRFCPSPGRCTAHAECWRMRGKSSNAVWVWPGPEA